MSFLRASRVVLGKARSFQPLNPFWEEVAQHKFADKTALPFVGESGKTVQDFVGRKLRGTGCHGPERSELMKLVLWNRLRQLRPQRTYVPSAEETVEKNKLDISILWFFLSIGFIYLPYVHEINHFASHNDHLPFMPPRTDGTHGYGAPHWWYETR